MNKISGILPSNSRLTAVDLKDAGPVRAGQPDFGRGNAQVTKRGGPKLFVQEVGNAYEQFSASKLKERRNAKIADQVADKFFQHQKPIIDQQGPTLEPIDHPVNVPDIGFSEAKNNLSQQTQNINEENNKLFVAGGNLNVEA